MRRAAVLVITLAVGLGASACGSDSTADSDTTAPAGTTDSTSPDSTTTAPPTTTAPTTTAAPTTVAASTTAAPTTAPATTAPPATAPPTTLPPFPPGLAELPEPPDVWSVVLAGSPVFDDPILLQAQADAATAGYNVGVTDCDEGAAEALGMSGSGVYTVTVYLQSEADAHLAAEAFAARGIPGVVALVHLFCLD